MPLSLQQDETVCAAIRRNVRKRIGRALELLDAGVDGDSGERVHEARKQLKQVRTLLHLMPLEAGRKRCARADRLLRKVTRALSGIRDATVLVETLLQFGPRAQLTPASLALFRSTLEFSRNRLYESVLANPRHRERLQEALREARKEILSWSAIPAGWQAIGPKLREIYGTARAAAAVTARVDTRDDAALHESRKQAKDLLQVLEFLRGMSPNEMKNRIRAVHQLTELLGKDHDLAVLQAVLEGPLQRQLMDVELRRFLQIVARRRRLLQRRAATVCTANYVSDEAAFVKKIHRSWTQWRGRKEGARRQRHALEAHM